MTVRTNFLRPVLSEPKRPIFTKLVRAYTARFLFLGSGLTYYRGSYDSRMDRYQHVNQGDRAAASS
jgi:hypothetical protein